jgi:hypothetical protein
LSRKEKKPSIIKGKSESNHHTQKVKITKSKIKKIKNYRYQNKKIKIKNEGL